MVSRTQRGFTLIELVVVIVILGILSAFAVPRFIGLERQAREASVRALAGSLRSAATLARSASVASSLAHNAAVRMENQNVAMNFAYPTATATGIGRTLQDTTGFTLAHNAGVTTYTRQGAANPASCRVTYTAPTVLGAPPTIAISNPLNCQ